MPWLGLPPTPYLDPGGFRLRCRFCDLPLAKWSGTARLPSSAVTVRTDEPMAPAAASPEYHPG